MRSPLLEPIIEENSNSSSEAAFQVYNENYIKRKLSELSVNQGGWFISYKFCILFFFTIAIIVVIVVLDHYKIIH